MSTAEAWPTEDLATKAVDAAARKAFEVSRAAVAKSTGIPVEHYSDWDGIGRVVQLQWREQVLPIVWAALTGLPDPRYAAWEEGAASTEWNFESSQITTTNDNPYPSGI